MTHAACPIAGRAAYALLPSPHYSARPVRRRATRQQENAVKFFQPARASRVSGAGGCRRIGADLACPTRKHRRARALDTRFARGIRTHLRAARRTCGEGARAAGRLRHSRQRAAESAERALGLAQTKTPARSGRFIDTARNYDHTRDCANSPAGCGGFSGSKSLQRPCCQRPDARSMSIPPASRNTAAA